MLFIWLALHVLRLDHLSTHLALLMVKSCLSFQVSIKLLLPIAEPSLIVQRLWTGCMLVTRLHLCAYQRDVVERGLPSGMDTCRPISSMCGLIGTHDFPPATISFPSAPPVVLRDAAVLGAGGLTRKSWFGGNRMSRATGFGAAGREEVREPGWWCSTYASVGLGPHFLVWRKCKASRKCLPMTCKNHRLRKMPAHHHSLLEAGDQS